MVEFAVVCCLCFVLLFAIFEYGRYLMVRAIVDNAAREGARVAIVSPSSLTVAQATANVNAMVTQTMASQQLTNYAVQIYQADDTGTSTGAWTDTAFGGNIVVQVTGSYTPMFPTFGFLPNPVPVVGTSMMRCEAN
jgi:Flp pilus assembly protein TadG